MKRNARKPFAWIAAITTLSGAALAGCSSQQVKAGNPNGGPTAQQRSALIRQEMQAAHGRRGRSPGNPAAGQPVQQ